MIALFVFIQGNLVLNKNELLLIKEFKDVYERDTSKDKVFAYKEFNYIYQRADYSSYPNRNGLTDKEANDYAIEVAELDTKYVPDEIVINAIKRYKKEQETRIIRLNNAVLKSLNNTYITVELLNELMMENINNIKELKSKPNSDPEKISNLMSVIIKDQEKLLGISNSLPTLIKSHKQYEELLKKDEEAGKEIQGGGLILDSMNPEE